MRLLLALVLLPACGAAADIALWQAGPGTIDGAQATAQAVIQPGQEIAAGDKPARVVLARAPKTSLILAPQARLRLVETDGGLQAELLAGTVQANVVDKGPYADVHVLGASLDVRVTGTLFMVERVKADTDYVALVEGRIKVSLREQVARALGQEIAPIELGPRQGLEGSPAGFGQIEALSSRPQLPVTVASRSVREQSVTTGAGGSSWSTDQAMVATAVVAAPVVEAPVVITPTLAPEIAPTDLVQSGIQEQVRTAVVESVVTGVSQAVQQQIQQQVVESTVANPALGKPPGPPGE